MERFTEPEAPRGDASLALDELELRVEVVVGECRVPLGELAQLSAGQALLLHRATEDGVEVRVQGRTIGEGELIDVDGVLAVRLTKWDGGTL
ncbi:MAG: FliM/FliN family flagellar motor switch protein [Myxococcales bacterium]|nr:FliM/FliN family flagellar motor switch protein [Myxococcales bacterium]